MVTQSKLQTILGTMGAMVKKIDQDFLNKFIDGELRTRKGQEYLYQGGISSIELQDKPVRKIIVHVGWLVKRVRPVLVASTSSQWEIQYCGDGYRMEFDVSEIKAIVNSPKKSTERTLVILSSDGERTRFVAKGHEICIEKTLSFVSKPEAMPPSE